jgi:ferrochelatase
MSKKGLLLLNLGSPDAPKTKEVRRYLTQFLTDKYVIDIPFVLRQLLVRLIIAPFRAPKSAEAYEKIWTENGSPLVHFTRTFAQKVAQAMSPEWSVRWAMRYGNPSISDTMANWDIDELYIVPLYPQYAESSSRTAIDDALAQAKRHGLLAKTKILMDFYAEPEFITSEAQIISRYVKQHRPDHVLLSFHGLPEHHLSKMYPTHCGTASDCCAQVRKENRYCYRAQCFRTAAAIGQELGLGVNQISLGFQSRLGRRPWIKPYTDELLTPLIKSGVKRLLVSCPSFVSDCLETLEEIQMRLKEQFIEEGGEDLVLVPALNNDDTWVNNFVRMLSRTDLAWKSADADIFG